MLAHQQAPFVVGYLPQRIIRHVMREEMTEAGIHRYLVAMASLISEMTEGGTRYHLLGDARRKSFASLDGMRMISEGIRSLLVAEQIDRKALLTSEAWFGSADADGIPSFRDINEAWSHLTDHPQAIPQVALVVGSTGAGKTTFARYLAGDFGAQRFSIDEWMKRLHIPDRPADAGFDWYWERIQRCEAVIRDSSERLVELGIPLVLDLGLSDEEHRATWLAWAQRRALDAWIYYVDVPADERWRRVEARNQSASRSSLVTREMFDFVEQRFEPPTSDEAKLAVVRW